MLHYQATHLIAEGEGSKENSSRLTLASPTSFVRPSVTVVRKHGHGYSHASSHPLDVKAEADCIPQGIIN